LIREEELTRHSVEIEGKRRQSNGSGGNETEDTTQPGLEALEVMFRPPEDPGDRGRNHILADKEQRIVRWLTKA
jgi:hypothetical protein